MARAYQTKEAIARVDFDSVADMIDWIEAQPHHSKHATSGIMGADRDNNGASWYGTESYPASMGLLRHGWPEGRALLAKSAKAIKPLTIARGRLVAQGYDVGGAYPMVPLAVAGEPACMVTVGEQERATRPFVRFYIALCVSGGIEAKTIRARGAAILAWVDALESTGARCEIVLQMATGYERKNNAHMTVTAKRADEHLDLDRMAYVLTNASFFRRQCFAFIERCHPDVSNLLGLGYGMPHDVPSDEPNTVNFGHAMFGRPEWSHPDKAAAFVKAEILAACGDLGGMLDAA